LIVQREYESIKKEFDSKSKTLDKLNEFVELSKEMLRNTQSEKDTLASQLYAERETARKLHNLAEVSQKDSVSFEVKVQTQEKALEVLNHDNANLERQYVN